MTTKKFDVLLKLNVKSTPLAFYETGRAILKKYVTMFRPKLKVIMLCSNAMYDFHDLFVRSP